MEELMNGLCATVEGKLELRQVVRPLTAPAGHLLIRVIASGINGGDKAFLGRPGGLVKSLYDVWGVSLAGEVMAVGDGVPERYRGSLVMGYRSLVASPDIVGVWSEYAVLPYLSCVVLPSDVSAGSGGSGVSAGSGVDAEDYAGSLVNIITPYAFWQQVREEGHRAIISTAGSSATGLALLGLSLAKGFPLISLVRSEDARQELLALGAEHVLLSGELSRLEQLAGELSATAVFDGVGGAALNPMLAVLPVNSTIYAYGYLGGATPLSFHTSILQRGLTIRPFSNFRSSTVQDPRRLEQALLDIGSVAARPYFKTKVGRRFAFSGIDAAMAYVGPNGEKAILRP